jgi:arabinofuranan 3-O-arabinosyltransferase
VQATAPTAALLAGDPVDATLCSGAPVTLGAETHTVSVVSNDVAAPTALTFTRGAAKPLASAVRTAGTVDVRSWGRTSRTVSVQTSAASILLVRENANAGWRATLGSTALRPVTVDGWQQGWLLPAGSDGLVRLQYRPQPIVDAGFAAGAAAVLVLLALALVRGRRRQPPAAEWRPGRLVSGLIVIAGLGLLGSVAGLVVGVVLVAARRFVPLPGWSAGALALVAGVIAAAGPAGSTHRWDDTAVAQIVCLVAVGVVVVRSGEPQ